ncbi:lytic transglycosylase, partial [Candidatus Gracilibacteria bacterium]|nr:lytic transglycosylase [Candidatus Gracilibacteria bacterium]
MTNLCILMHLAVVFALTSCVTLERSPPANEPIAPTTAVISAVPTAELPAAELLARGLALRVQGEDERAALDFSALLATYPAAAEAREARYFLAEVCAPGRWNSAIELFRALAVEPYADPLAQRALFWLALGYENAGDAAQAVDAYARYRALNTPIEPYAAWRQADQLAVLDRDAESATALQHVVNSALAPRQRASAAEQAIAAARARGDADAALALYTDLLAFAQQPQYRARLLVEAAELARTDGDSAQAVAWLGAALAEAPGN